MALGGSAPRRYAEAMLDLALAANAVDGFHTSPDRLAAAFAGPAVRALRDPGIPIARRRAAVAAATAAEPADVRSLIRLLVERDRIALLPDIARAYGTLVDRRAGIADARITTAVALTQAQRDDYVRRLERTSGTTVRATFAVDPALLGGAKVQVGDRLVDASLAARLAELGAQLAS